MKIKMLLSVLLFVLLLGIIFTVLFMKEQSIKKDRAAQEARLKGVHDSISNQNYPEAITRIESSLKEAQGLEEEAQLKYSLAFTNTVIFLKDSNNNESFEKAFSLAKEIARDGRYSKILRAQSIEIIDRLLVNRINRELQQVVVNDTYVKGFSPENSDFLTIRKNLLLHGVQIYPLAGIEMRLAIVDAQNIIELNKQESGAQKEIAIERAKKNFMNAITAANVSLGKDYTGNNSTNIPEVLLSKVIAAQYFFDATQTTPLGTIDELYMEAFASADQYFKPMRDIIQVFFDESHKSI